MANNISNINRLTPPEGRETKKVIQNNDKLQMNFWRSWNNGKMKMNKKKRTQDAPHLHLDLKDQNPTKGHVGFCWKNWCISPLVTHCFFGQKMCVFGFSEKISKCFFNEIDSKKMFASFFNEFSSKKFFNSLKLTIKTFRNFFRKSEKVFFLPKQKKGSQGGGGKCIYFSSKIRHKKKYCE